MDGTSKILTKLSADTLRKSLENTALNLNFFEGVGFHTRLFASGERFWSFAIEGMFFFLFVFVCFVLFSIQLPQKGR